MIRIGNCASSARDEFTYRNGYADHFAIRFRWDQCEHSQAWGTLRRKEIFSSDDQLRWRRRHRRIDVFRVRLFGTRRTDAESNQNEKNACGDLADGDRGKRHSTCLLAYWTPFRLIVCCVFGELHDLRISIENGNRGFHVRRTLDTTHLSVLWIFARRHARETDNEGDSVAVRRLRRDIQGQTVSSTKSFIGGNQR